MNWLVCILYELLFAAAYHLAIHSKACNECHFLYLSFLTAEPTVMLSGSPRTFALSTRQVIAPVIDHGRPRATIQWNRTSAGHPPLDFSRLVVDQESGSLTIPSVTGDDRGTYMITATNTEGTFEGMANASVDIFVNCR